MLTVHAAERLIDRAGARCAFTDDDVSEVARFLSYVAPRFDSAGIHLADVPMTGQAWSETSNGDQLWAVVRDGNVTTVMLRRSTQPASGLRTERVLDARDHLSLSWS